MNIIERSILVILNAYYNTGNKSMRGSFDPPTQVTIIEQQRPFFSDPWRDYVTKGICIQSRAAPTDAASLTEIGPVVLMVRPLQYRFLVRHPHPFQEDAVFNCVLMALHLFRLDCLPTMNFCGHITTRTNDIKKH